MNEFPNPGKKLSIEIDGTKWFRYPVRTHFILPKDNIDEIIEKYILSDVKTSDNVVFSQKIISILENRIIYRKDVKVGFWANFLSKFVKKTPYGFSVGNPLKMQVAIDMAGLPRIIFSGIIGFIGKLIGLPGTFYKLAGHQINQLDGFYGVSFPQYADMGILGFKNCDDFCNKLRDKYGFSVIVADINDLGGNILGRGSDLKGKDKLFLKILKDNPGGQSNEQTPILILRK